jgi:hypothetical protein
MSIDTSSHTINSYKLVPTTFAFKSDCPICLMDNQDIFSFHLVCQETYNKEIHGEITTKGSLRGVVKNIEIQSSDETGVSAKKTLALFCQIAKNKKDGKLHLFSPLHGACNRCITKVQSICPYKCPICRTKIEKAPLPSALPQQLVVVPRTYHPIDEEEFIDFLDYGIEEMMDSGKKGSGSHARVVRKITMSKITKSFNQLKDSL